MVTYLNNEEKEGGFWLPNIQRPFVWNEEQIERLFDSIMREYPISTLLAWKSKSSIRRRKFIDNYRSTIKLTNYYVPVDDKQKILILDGQQRLQSLYIGLKGSFEGKELYLDILSGDLVAPEDIRFKFSFLTREKAKFPFIRFKDIVFSNERVSKMKKSIIENANRELSDEEEERVEENVEQVFHMFREEEVIVYQELDSIDNPKLYTENDIVEIFIRANSGGTKLGKSDLLFSLLTSSWEDADERLEEILEDLNREGYAFTRDFVLKSCLTILGKGARYDVSKFRDGSTRDQIIDNWEKIAAAIRAVKDFIYGKTYLRSDKAVPSYLTFIPIIYFRYHYPEKWNQVKNLDVYILRTLITGAFSGTPDNLIDKCTKKIDELKEYDVNELFSVIRADGRNLEVTPDTILGQYYGSKLMHLIFNLWYKDFNYRPAYRNNLPQIDHIFPQSLLRTVKDVSPETGRRSILKYKDFDRNQIANCMLLTAEENGAGGKSDTPPDVWFEDKSEEYLDMHLIPRDKELWKLENYEKFLEARKTLILEKFDNIIQKEVGEIQ
jgi:hypothetical protein